MNDERFCVWLRASFDKLLLTVILFVLLGVTLHVLHDARDNDAQIQFLDGLTNTISGALIVLVTGAVARKSSEATAVTRDPQTGASSVTTAKEEEK